MLEAPSKSLLESVPDRSFSASSMATSKPIESARYKQILKNFGITEAEVEASNKEYRKQSLKYEAHEKTRYMIEFNLAPKPCFDTKTTEPWFNQQKTPWKCSKCEQVFLNVRHHSSPRCPKCRSRRTVQQGK